MWGIGPPFFSFLFGNRGTHGYMAPEVLSKGTAYDSSADWFSFGCMLYKLLKGHSPFRQHKTKDKHEIDRMTLTMVRIRRYSRCNINDPATTPKSTGLATNQRSCRDGRHENSIALLRPENVIWIVPHIFSQLLLLPSSLFPVDLVGRSVSFDVDTRARRRDMCSLKIFRRLADSIVLSTIHFSFFFSYSFCLSLSCRSHSRGGFSSLHSRRPTHTKERGTAGQLLDRAANFAGRPASPRRR